MRRAVGAAVPRTTATAPRRRSSSGCCRTAASCCRSGTTSRPSHARRGGGHRSDGPRPAGAARAAADPAAASSRWRNRRRPGRRRSGRPTRRPAGSRCRRHRRPGHSRAAANVAAVRLSAAPPAGPGMPPVGPPPERAARAAAGPGVAVRDEPGRGSRRMRPTTARSSAGARAADGRGRHGRAPAAAGGLRLPARPAAHGAAGARGAASSTANQSAAGRRCHGGVPAPCPAVRCAPAAPGGARPDPGRRPSSCRRSGRPGRRPPAPTAAALESTQAHAGPYVERQRSRVPAGRCRAGRPARRRVPRAATTTTMTTRPR